MPTNTLSWRSNGTRTATGSSRPHAITSSSCLTWETWRKSYRLLKGTRKKLQVSEILFICFQFVSTNFIMPPTSTKLKGGILVSPCPSVRLPVQTCIMLWVCSYWEKSVCPFVDRIVYALYLQQYSSDPFHICTSYQATSEGVSRVQFFSKFKKKSNFGKLF